MTKAGASVIASRKSSVHPYVSKNRFRRMMYHDIAIDLGTINTLISVEGQGVILNEPSVVATHRKSKKIIALGSDAQRMIGRTPSSILASRPLVDGVVNDFEMVEYMIQQYFAELHAQHRVFVQRPRVIVGLPSGVTEVERRAVEEAAKSAGARKVYLIPEPVAAVIGAGIDITGESGTMVVDIGGGTTEVAVVANGQMVVSSSLRIAGEELTETIVQYVREEHNMQIGERTAEEIKMSIGAVFAHNDKKTMPVRGRNTITGLPQEIELRSDILRIPLTRQIRPIMDGIKSVLEQTPPELLSDIMKDGILVAGGGAFLAGIDLLIKQETHIDVITPNNALTAVVEGAAQALRNPEKYKRVLLVSG